MGASAYPATLSLIHCAVRYRGELTRAITRLSSRSAFAVATPSACHTEWPRAGDTTETVESGYMDSISLVTRSSWARNGSFSSTVRCAWSLSLR